MTRRTVALLGVLALGVALRLIGLTSFPFEQDELYTIHEATRLYDSALRPGIHARPLFFLIEHVLLALHAPTPGWLRLLPFVCGVAGVWITWKLGQHVFGDLGGLVAAFFAAVSPWHIYASGFGRYYAMLYALAAAAYWLLLRAYESDRPRAFLAALLVLLTGSATHPSFVFPMVGAVMGLSLVTVDGRFGWRWPSRVAWRWLWGPYGAALVLAFVALKLTGSESAVRNFGGRGVLASLRLVPAMVQWMTPTMFVAGALGAVLCALRGDSAPRVRWGVVATLGAGGALLLLLAASFRTDVYADYGLATLPLTLVSAGGLIVWGVQALPTRASATAAAVAAAVLLAGVLPSTVSHFFDGTRFDYRPALAYVAQVSPGTLVVSRPIVLQRHYAPDLRGAELRGRLSDLDSLVASESDAWVIVPVQRYGILGDRAGTLRGWLFARCRMAQVHEPLRFDYRTYRVELHRCAPRAAPQTR